MSDSIKKYEEMLEEGKISSSGTGLTFIYESPDGGKTITRRPIGSDVLTREVIRKKILDEGTKMAAYQILLEFSEESILEAARILNGR